MGAYRREVDVDGLVVGVELQPLRTEGVVHEVGRHFSGIVVACGITQRYGHCYPKLYAQSVQKPANHKKKAPWKLSRVPWKLASSMVSQAPSFTGSTWALEGHGRPELRSPIEELQLCDFCAAEGGVPAPGRDGPGLQDSETVAASRTYGDLWTVVARELK
jgi:hypothetical protein